jgi:hypothetical protein
MSEQQQGQRFYRLSDLNHCLACGRLFVRRARESVCSLECKAKADEQFGLDKPLNDKHRA